MTILFAILATLWWLAIWGTFDIFTKHYTEREKLTVYVVIMGVVLVTIAFFPKILNHL
jgi:hypothetical protein